MIDKKFDPKKLQKLNNPERLKTQNPDLIWSTLNLQEPKTLVDIGAGTGFFAVPFSEKMKAGTVYAMDTSDTMLDWMKENIVEKSQNRVVPMKCGESSLPLEDGIADLVYMINLHHELNDPKLMLAESVRVLKKGGLLLIIDWKVEDTPSGPPLEIRVPAETIARQLKESGLQQITDHDILPHHCFIVGKKEI